MDVSTFNAQIFPLETNQARSLGGFGGSFEPPFFHQKKHRVGHLLSEG